jgi:hypothetical protein
MLSIHDGTVGFLAAFPARQHGGSVTILSASCARSTASFTACTPDVIAHDV